MYVFVLIVYFISASHAVQPKSSIARSAKSPPSRNGAAASTGHTRPALASTGSKTGGASAAGAQQKDAKIRELTDQVLTAYANIFL